MKHFIKISRQYVFSAVLCIIGLSVATGAWWGLVMEWNPDSLAFESLDTSYRIPKPYSYVHPPFVSYFHLYLSEIPIQYIGTIVRAPQNLLLLSRLTWSKFLTAGIYIASVVLFYCIVKRFIRKSFYAKALSILFGSSAGLVAYGHFLTADIPLMFCIVATWLCIVKAYQDSSIPNYITAGFLCGIAAAVKYTGIILIVPLLTAFFVSSASLYRRRNKQNGKWFDIRYVLRRAGVFEVLCVSVAAGFISGHPYVVMDFTNVYNTLFFLLQTNKYALGGNLFAGYTMILPGIIELIGKPAVVLIGALIVLSTVVLIWSKRTRSTFLLFVILNLSLIVPYIVFMAHSSFLPPRYLLPVIPSLFLLTVPFLYFIAEKRKAAGIMVYILVSVILYNFLCIYQIDLRFVFDPRMSAFTWSYGNIPDYSKIEKTQYTPDINAAFNRHIVVTFIPYMKERSISFTNLFANDKAMLMQIGQYYPPTDDNWFALDNLYKRNPDYILLNSWQYDDDHRSFIHATDYYVKLLHGDTKYRIVFDQTTPPMPTWSYPQSVDFLFSRMVILENSEKRTL